MHRRAPTRANAALLGAAAGALALRATMLVSRRAGLATTDLGHALAPGRRRAEAAAQLAAGTAILLPAAWLPPGAAALYGAALGAGSVRLFHAEDAGSRPQAALVATHALGAATASASARWAAAAPCAPR